MADIPALYASWQAAQSAVVPAAQMRVAANATYMASLSAFNLSVQMYLNAVSVGNQAMIAMAAQGVAMATSALAAAKAADDMAQAAYEAAATNEATARQALAQAIAGQ